MKAIEDLGFTPNSLARGLKTNHKRQIALAIDDIRNPFYPEFAWAAEQVAKENGYRMLLINHYGNASEELAVIREANEMHVDGIIILPLSWPKMLKQAVRKASVPVSMIGNGGEDMSADMVYLARSEGVLVMDHLKRIGRTRIAYVGGPKEMHQGTRYQSYVNAVVEQRGEVEPAYTFLGQDFSVSTGVLGATYLLSLPNLPDAVFAGNDLIAIGVVKTLLRKGVRVPDDIAVAGIDNISWCELTTPTITSVSNTIVEAGRLAAELLIQRVENHDDQDYQRLLLEPRLVPRESTVKILM